MIFEKADHNDINELVRLRLAYLAEDYGELAIETEERIAGQLPGYFREHLGRDLIAFLCRENGENVGVCMLYISEKPANPSFISGRTGSVLNVYTAPGYRRRGIAGELLRLLMSEAEALGLDFVELKATDAGYKLYRSLGFEDAPSKYHNMKFIFGNS